MKKAQLTNPNPQSMIALLIFIIGVALVMYILFLPPAERAELLEQNRSTPGDGTRDEISILMTQEPGRISNIADTEIIKALPSFNLFTRTDAKTLAEFDSIYIKKSLFEEQMRNITFGIEDLEHTDNYALSYNVQRHSGVLTIILNDNIILSNEITTASPAPLKLPKDLLKENNNLVFRVSGPGIEFWKSNQYILEDIKVTADFTDISAQENIQIIHVTEQEIDNLESMDLRFAVNCEELANAPLEIYLRKRLIYSSVPDCGTSVLIPPVDGSRLIEGENDLLFRTEKGNYLLYGIEAKLHLKKPLFPTYFFNLDAETFNKVKNDEGDLNVSILFPNSEDRKKGIILVNDYILEIETYDTFYNRKINSFVRQGNNAVEIQPKDEKLDIVELHVFLAE